MTTVPASVPGVDYPAPPYPGITYVIPCGGEKLDRAAPAGELYTGQMFRHALNSVRKLAGYDEAEGRGPARILILSALHGLVELHTVLEPYDLKMGRPGSVSVETLAEQALALGIDWGAQVYAFLPKAYLARLDEALRTHDVYVQDVYEGCEDANGRAGIGPQRRVLSIVARPSTTTPAAPAGDGLQVWIGADVNGFAWGVPILVSYGRLREAQTLPVATAPWVCDSRGFAEVAEHGTWTISAEQYVADLRRYAAEVGHLAWAAPQDWPAKQALLDRTGLTEHEHQARTTASVVELRAMAPELDIVTVVTGATAAGYARHVAMYEAAGIDLRAERLVVGVGALVGRTPTEVAEIRRVLHGLGLRRLHGFGVKGVALDLAGDLLESVDSAAWANEGMRRGGLCEHGNGIKHETNCPEYAQEWAARQRARAALAVGSAVPVQGTLFDLDGVPDRVTLSDAA